MRRLMKTQTWSSLLAPVAPFAIISCLLYAGFFVKPTPRFEKIDPPIFERGDRFYGMASQNHKEVWLVGGGGKIWKSSDGGDSWVSQHSGITSGLQDVAAWSATHAVVVGNGPKILRTTDGGITWQGVDCPRNEISNKLMHVRVVGEGRAWAVGEGGLILSSEDYGANWQLTGKAEDVAWNDIAFQGERGVLVGEFGRIKTSTDGGATWHESPSPVKSSLMSVAFRSATEAVAVGLGGVVLRSSNGGATWARTDVATKEHLFGLNWDGQRWIAVGDKGVVLLGSETAAEWSVQRVDSNDRAWYVSVLNSGDKYLLAGAKLSKAAPGSWQFDSTNNNGAVR